MAGWDIEWERYARWNLAIADVVFTRDAAGKPVYLDLEDGVLDEIRKVAEPEATDPAATLVDVVKGTLALRDGPADVLRGHLRRLKRWHEGSMIEPPPTLALLAMLSLVAETMHEGGGMKPHNFWGRFEELLNLKGKQLDWFRNAYRKQIGETPASTELWESLNDWLEMLEGERGLPTAHPIGHDHIGFPLSQALVRQTDRDHFANLFALNSLPPRSTLPAFDMETLIAEWISRKPCPASNTLEKLWTTSPDARARITDVALLTLESWDGTSSIKMKAGASPTVIDLVRTRVVMRSFPSTRVDISFVVPARTEEEVESVEVLDASGLALGSIDLVPVASGYLGLADPASIDVGSFLGGEARLRRPHTTQPLRRRARRVVPLRYDDLIQSFVECERVQLGEESLLLVRAELALQTSEVLSVVARPGFMHRVEIPGAPAGWHLFEGVQVLSSIPVEMRSKIRVDLNVLQPIATSQVVLQGGLRLPGNIAKWSSSIPPELVATAEVGASLTASLACTRPMTHPAPLDRSLDGSGEVLIWDLSDENLPDGDYEISIFDGGDRMKSEALRLRSADHPAVIIDSEELIAHLPGQPGYGLIAARTGSEAAFQGATTGDPIDVNHPAPTVPAWFVARKESPKARSESHLLRFPVPDDKSCMVTGAHSMSVETAMAGMTSVEGVCKSCGLVKRLPAFRGKKKSTKVGAKQPSAPHINVADLPPFEPNAAIDWTAAFDAVCHVGKGKAAALDRIASQMEATDLFGDAFERRLESLGHIEIYRSPTLLDATAFEVVEPYLCGLPGGSAVLCGFRSEHLLVTVEDLVYELHGDVVTEAVPSAPPVLRVAELADPDLHLVAACAAEALGKPMRFIPNAAIQLASELPALSAARDGLPATSVISARSFESWDPITARFVRADDASAPGAFRLTGFKRTYIYRSPADLGSMRATLGDTRIVKYLAALDAGRSLLGYDAGAEVLYVPLGADLPGLYGRAAVLASGRPPTENIKERILEYHGVSPELAAHLQHLLMT